jgi:hypothetical protein
MNSDVNSRISASSFLPKDELLNLTWASMDKCTCLAPHTAKIEEVISAASSK